MSHQLVHYGILLSNVVDKNQFISRVLSGKNEDVLNVFNGLKGMAFSDLTIAQFIKKEYKHRTIEITQSEERPLHTFSSGERRKVLLDYCLAQHPDFIIFDNPFDHLDQLSCQEFLDVLKELSASISILQIAHREESLLPFVERKGYVYDNSFTIHEYPKEDLDFKLGQDLKLPDSFLLFEKKYDHLFALHNVSVNYNHHQILKGISWKVNHGQFWQLIGPNGSGKSTLLSLITGDNPQGFGQDLLLFGRKKGTGESVWDIKNKIGYYSTNIAELFERNHTVEQMVLSGYYDSIGLYRQASDVQIKSVAKWLQMVNMEHLKKHYFNRLSNGQQRLILIIRAIIKQPPLLILDEPLEGLDQENMSMVSLLINKIVEQSNIAVIYVSHTFEPSLVPSHIYKLIPSAQGSIGRVQA